MAVFFAVLSTETGPIFDSLFTIKVESPPATFTLEIFAAVA